ncbi:MAG: hypothetical protein WBD22_14560 [Pyrinomonadaceae bacterium]
MKMMLIRIYFCALALLTIAAIFPASTDAQKRDYLTEAEVELVRDAQEIDRRIDVLTKAIDRRLAALSLGTAVVNEKEARIWGEIPTGSRLELYVDIKKLLQKAIDDIDSVAGHSSTAEPKTKQEHKEAQRFPNAVRRLAKDADRYLPIFRMELDKITNERDKGPLLDSIEFCSQIIEAAQKITGSSAIVR